MPPVSLQSRLMWHHSAHHQWGKARLCFWRLSFNPTYNRERVHDGIEQVLQRHSVTSYLAYEILGHFDVLLRVWLPTSVTADAMDLALYQELLGCDYHSSDFFEVTTVHWHWVWEETDSTGDRRMLAPEGKNLTHPSLSEAELEALDKLVIASGRDDSRLPGELPDDARQLLEAARDQTLVTALNHGQGIKVFAIISRPLGTLSKPARDVMSRRIRDVALGVDPDGNPILEEVSVYSGHGSASHIVAGRVPPTKFYSAVAHLTQQINSLGVHEYKIRVDTYVTSQPGFLMYSEALGLAGTREDVQVDTLLQSEEEPYLEFKASAFASLRSKIDQGAKRYDHDPGLALSIAKTVGGFLNSSQTGYLVIGAVEENAYIQAKGRYRSEDERAEAHRRLRATFKEYRKDLLICGLAPDFELGKRGDWDEWRQRFQQLVRSMIEPNPLPWITIQRYSVNDEEIAVVAVRPNDGGWSYVVYQDKDGTERRRFYVREHHTTREYQGVEGDDYKRGDKLHRGGSRFG